MNMGEDRESKRGKKRKYPQIVYIIGFFGIVATIVLGSLVLTEINKEVPDFSGLFQNAILSIACSVVASYIFILIQKAFTDDENKELSKQLDDIEQSLKRQNELYDSGIHSIHPKAHFDKEEDFWKDIINNTETRLDLIGHSISNWFKHEYRDLFCDKITKMVEDGKEVSIILSGDEIRIEQVRAAFRQEVKERQLKRVERTVLYFMQMLESIQEDKRSNLKVYVTELEKVTYLYIRTDNQCIISPYIQSPNNIQNSFLLELQVGTEYVKNFEDNFREMIAEMDCLDLSIPGTFEDLKLKKNLKVENEYSGSNWNHEKTTKYVFEDRDVEYEAGYFEHYQDQNFVKSVIELPISYGCPAKCRFCASSAIDAFQPMKTEQMFELFEYIYKEHHLYAKDYVLLTLTGTGDLFFNFENVKEFLKRLPKYTNLYVTLSSCLWNKSLLSKVESLENNLKIRNIQLTYISDTAEKCAKLIPAYTNRNLDIEGILEYVKKSDKNYYRINYILIHQYNDTDADVGRLIELLTEVKDKVVVRISKLNETLATQRNGLQPVEIERMKQIQELFTNSGIKSYIFYSKKNDMMNCGQLITEK